MQQPLSREQIKRFWGHQGIGFVVYYSQGITYEYLPMLLHMEEYCGHALLYLLCLLVLHAGETFRQGSLKDLQDRTYVLY